MVNHVVEHLESFRPYLEVWGWAYLSRYLWWKIHPAEVVQQTVVKALTALANRDPGEPLPNEAWIRAILVNTLTDVLRRFGAEKRDAGAGIVHRS